MDQEKIISSLKSQMLHVETPISVVFFKKNTVYKLKKSVDFGFLDFTTVAKRKKYCNQEIILNRRICPSLYKKVLPVTYTKEKASIRGRGNTVDHVVVMKRLPESSNMTKLIKNNKVSMKNIRDIIRDLTIFYSKTKTSKNISRFGKIKSVKFNTDENFIQTFPFKKIALSNKTHSYLKRWTNNFFKSNKKLFSRRIKEGKVKDCHGDLHTGNIFIFKRVYITDCIEFNNRFRYSDQIADMGFLAMDLDYLGKTKLSKYLMEQYSKKSGDDDIDDITTFYKIYRAFVRGKVACFRYAQGEKKFLQIAKKYFRLAEKYAKT